MEEEKAGNSGDGVGPPFADEERFASAPLPQGRPWMYKSPKIGPFKLPYYASPWAQLLIVSFVCFLCPGMFNAVNGLGAGGGVDPGHVNKANTALYSTFAVVGFFAGSIANRLGLRTTLFFGGFGYFLYVASLLSYTKNGNGGFVIFAGALLGVCAGCLWCAQGTVMMSYPEEKSKGKFISWFWMIFNLGGVIGSLVSSVFAFFL
jgi:MFS family permease